MIKREIITSTAEYQRGYRRNNPDKCKKYTKTYYESHKEEYKKKTYSMNRLYKEKVFSHYGYNCKCCGEVNEKFLNIDHIKGKKYWNHNKHMRGAQLYRWLTNNNFPEGFQTLCFNCNMAKGIYGICPHQLDIILEN